MKDVAEKWKILENIFDIVKIVCIITFKVVKTSANRKEIKMKPETVMIDEVRYVREDSINIKPEVKIISSEVAPWNIGAIYLIRTVTMIDTGILVAVTPTELVLEEAAWIADTGRFSDAIAKAEFNEVEPFPAGKLIIGRGSIVDAIEITKVQRSKK